MALSKRVLSGLSQRIFTFVSTRDKAAEAVSELQDLKRSILISSVASLVLGMSGLALWQGLRVKSPLAVYVTCGLPLALAGRGKKALGKQSKAAEIATVEGNAKHERELQRRVADHFPETAPHAITSDLGGSIVIALRDHGVNVHYLGMVYAPAFCRVKLRPDRGVTVDRIKRLAESLQTRLGTSQVPIITEQADCVTIDAERRDREFIPIEKFLNPGFFSEGTPVTLPAGVNIDGKLILITPSHPETCHILIGGTTGSGKSEQLRGWMRWLTQWSPRDVQVLVIDPKRVTFSDFEAVSQLKKIAGFTGKQETDVLEVFPELADADRFASEFKKWLPWGIVKDSSEAASCYGKLFQLMEERYQLFEKLGAKDLAEYNARVRRLNDAKLPPMPTVFAICDEYYMQVSVDKTVKEKTEDALKKLAAKARAAGICLILATQRPEMTVVTPLIRSMFPARVCLKVATVQDSEIILGRSDETAQAGAYLLGRGDLWFLGATGILERLQALYWDGRSLPGVIDVEAVDLTHVPVLGGDELGVSQPKSVEVVQTRSHLQVVQSVGPARLNYESYRQHRESGEAPYKWYQAHGGASRTKITELETAMARYFPEWMRELAAQGLSTDQIVTHIWNITERNDRAAGEKFRERKRVVENAIGANTNVSTPTL